ncbi:DUF998 domain-containing protein [Pseudokineococcus basanitobsidens]|uniref:DUF998 domain-containing protein n=1 Tax=Pseudokineococcus basanitobsidens TaxID=1926649 RepID=A0ABU8RJS8_9ACTN
MNQDLPTTVGPRAPRPVARRRAAVAPAPALPPAPARPPALVLPPALVRRRAAAGLGALTALAALAVLWVARLQVDGEGVYVSQLGADGMPTAAAFNTALLALAVGGGLVAWSVRGHRACEPLLRTWSTSATLAAACLAFAAASRVTCTAGCPVPLTTGATAQDLVHTSSAVVGFGAAAWAMLQVGWSACSRALRRASRGAAAAVGGAAAAGGLLSVAGLGTDVGAALEHLATTVAVLWLPVLAAGAAGTGLLDQLTAETLGRSRAADLRWSGSRPRATSAAVTPTRR